MECGNPAIITFDYALFQAQIPEYATTPIESVVQGWWNIAILYVSDINCGALCGDARAYAINLMAAHLIWLSLLAPSGQVPAMMQNAQVDKVSVGVTPPPLPNQWQWWLNLSPYGQMLLALLQAVSAGGFYIPGAHGGIRGYPTTPGFWPWGCC